MTVADVERRDVHWPRRRNDLRFALMMVVALIATYGAWTAHGAARQAAETSQRARLISQQARAAGQQAHAIALVVATGNFEALQHGLLKACERVNALRVQQSNANSRATFAALTVLDRIVAEPSLLANLSRRDVILRQRGVRELRRVLATLVVTAATDCAAAVAHPDTYVPPSVTPLGAK